MCAFSLSNSIRSVNTTIYLPLVDYWWVVGLLPILRYCEQSHDRPTYFWAWIYQSIFWIDRYCYLSATDQSRNASEEIFYVEWPCKPSSPWCWHILGRVGIERPGEEDLLIIKGDLTLICFWESNPWKHWKTRVQLTVLPTREKRSRNSEGRLNTLVMIFLMPD